MKKPATSVKSKQKKPSKSSPKGIAPLEDPLVESSVPESNLADDQFSVTGREDEAASSGHRIKPVEEDDENNAEKLVEEGLQGYMHGSLKKPRKSA